MITYPTWAQGTMSPKLAASPVAKGSIQRVRLPLSPEAIEGLTNADKYIWLELAKFINLLEDRIEYLESCL